MPTMIDMEKIVKDYSATQLAADDLEKVDLKNPIIVWTGMLVTNAPAVFKAENSKSTIKTHSLFRSVFCNDTLSPQIYSVKNVRTTVSLVDCHLEHFFKYNLGTELVVHDEVVSLQKMETIGKKVVDEKPQEVEWVIKMDVSVPPQLSTTLEVLVKEKEIEEDFEVVSTFDGSVKVIYLDDDDFKERAILEISVREMFTCKQKFLIDKKGRPFFITKGRLKNRIGAEQLVQLTEGPLPPKTD